MIAQLHICKLFAYKLHNGGRALLLAFLFVASVLSTSVVHAHALPGSLLTITQNSGKPTLSVSFPLDELLIAAPEFDTLKRAAKAGNNISGDNLAELGQYLRSHLTLAKNAKPLPLILNSAVFERAFNEHVGDYTLVNVSFTLPLAKGKNPLPLHLTYDALMHEIRSHRAVVYWQALGAKPKHIGEFGYRKVNGKTPTYKLQLRE